ncbi:hypothetical protein JCM10908_000879 [Rhodotorula pacifica]|uniref:transcriptional repressor TCF25 family protein n=1 Tax=Rhodotorula pacifica TaxID=1495444 RepID=UPI00317BE33C
MGRLNKRQQRELAELEELERSRSATTQSLPTEDDVEESSDGEGGEPVAIAQPKAGFGALDLGADEEEAESASEQDEALATPAKANKSNRKKKKKAKATADSPAQVDSNAAPSADGSPFPSPATPAKSAKKKNKKSKAAGTPAAAPDDGMDEIDRALAELAVKNGSSEAEIAAERAQQSIRADPKWIEIKELYSFESKYLDADAELRRMFGSKVIGNTPQTPRSHLHARFANNPHHSTSIRRTSSFLATPEPGWPSATGVLGLERYEGPETDRDESGEWFSFVHPLSYRQAQLMFLEVLQQADGNRLYDVLAAQPYHVDTHLQLSEMMAQQGDSGASSTHLSRALYALSAPLPPTSTSGSFRLPYSRIENRALYIAIARKVALLVKGGTWRTAFEWAKIGLSISGNADPFGMLCWLDVLAPKAGQNDWLSRLAPALEKAYPDMYISSYPGLAYAKALCLRNVEQERKSNNDDESIAALVSAVLRFPMVATQLSNVLAIDMPPAFITNKRAQPDGTYSAQPSYALSLLAELYAVRAGPLWKDPEATALLRRAIAKAAPLLDDQSNEDVKIGEELYSKGPFPAGHAPAGVIRAAFISDAASIRPYLPPAARSGTSYSFDPLPPTDPLTTFYDDSYFAPLHGAAGARRRNPRLPGGGPRTQQQGGADVAAAMRDGLMRLLGMGAEGPQVELNEEVRAELLEELAMLNAGGMPGALGGEDEEDEQEEDWEDDGAEGRGEAVQGLLQRMAGMLGLGGAGTGPGAEEEEAAAEEEEDEPAQAAR